MRPTQDIQQAALVLARHLGDIIRKCLVYLFVRPVWRIGIAECRRHPDALKPAPWGLFADCEPHQQIIVSDRGKPFLPVAHRADVHIHLPGYIFLRKPGFQPALRKNKSFTFSEISSTFHFITLNFLHVLRSKCGKIFIQQQSRKYKEIFLQKIPWK